MAWVVTGIGVGVGTTALGAIQANQNRIAQNRANQANANISAAQAQYSPWTKMNPSTPQIGAVEDKSLGQAAQGALSGAMFASKLKGNAAAPEAAADTASAMAPAAMAATPISPTNSYVPMMDEMNDQNIENGLSGFSKKSLLPNRRPR